MLILYFPIADYIFNTTSLIAIEFLHFMNMSHKRWSITWIKFSQIDRNCSLFDNQYLDVEPLAAMMHQSMATICLFIYSIDCHMDVAGQLMSSFNESQLLGAPKQVPDVEDIGKKFRKTMRELEVTARNSSFCLKSDCTNFGNSKCRGYCHGCYNSLKWRSEKVCTAIISVFLLYCKLCCAVLH